MNELPRSFGPQDLPDGDEVGTAELATSLRLGREVDAYAATTNVEPTLDFTDRIMAAVAVEPEPSPAIAAGRAVTALRPIGLLTAFRDAWRVAFSGGRPMLIRAQALALVIVALVAIGGVGGAATVGALSMLERSAGPEPSPSLPTVVPSPSPLPSARPSPMPSLSPTPSHSPEPTETPEVTETTQPTRTDDNGQEPTETPEGSDDHGGSGGDGSDDGSSGGGSGSGSGSGSGGSGSGGSGSDDPSSGSDDSGSGHG